MIVSRTINSRQELLYEAIHQRKEKEMSAYTSEILVIVISAIGLLGIVAFLIWLSPFPFRRTAICVFGGMVILAGIVWVIQNAEFAAAESLNQFHTFSGIRHYDWYTFPMLNSWQLILMYAAIAITVTAPVYAIVRQVSHFLARRRMANEQFLREIANFRPWRCVECFNSDCQCDNCDCEWCAR